MALEHWQSSAIGIVGIQDLVDEAVIAHHEPWAPWVFVGTDNVESRWLVQKTWPEHLVVAGTAGFMAMVSEHDRLRPCAGCLHASSEVAVADVPTVSFVSYLGGLMGAARLIRWRTQGASTLGEQESEAWADRLDGEYGFRNASIPRRSDCPVESVVAG